MKKILLFIIASMLLLNCDNPIGGGADDDKNTDPQTKKYSPLPGDYDGFGGGEYKAIPEKFVFIDHIPADDDTTVPKPLYGPFYQYPLGNHFYLKYMPFWDVEDYQQSAWTLCYSLDVRLPTNGWAKANMNDSILMTCPSLRYTLKFDGKTILDTFEAHREWAENSGYGSLEYEDLDSPLPKMFHVWEELGYTFNYLDSSTVPEDLDSLVKKYRGRFTADVVVTAFVYKDAHF